MFYPELLKVSSDEENLISLELAEKMDTWLGTLPDDISSKITVSRFSKQFNLDYTLSRAILEKLCNLGVLKHSFAILCPNCNQVLKITDEKNLINDISNTTFCYACNDEEIVITSKNIEVRYNLVKKPNDPEKMNNLYEKILGEKYVSEQDSIDSLINNSDYNVNKLFYDPTKEEYKELEELFRGINKNFDNTTEKGDSLEDLALKILNLVKVFSATEAKTKTNQIDCFVVNKSPISNALFKKIGSVVYCECKNENKKVDNNYFHKLSNIIILSRSNEDEYRVGIIFSKQTNTSTCNEISKQAYYKQRLFLVNFDLEEIKEMVYERVNFLDYLNYKISIIENNLIPSLELKHAFLS